MGHQFTSLRWLEQKIAVALYDEEVRQGAWTVDVGLLGPRLFRKEAARILAEMRPEFGYLMDGKEETSRSSNQVLP